MVKLNWFKEEEQEKIPLFNQTDSFQTGRFGFYAGSQNQASFWNISRRPYADFQILILD